MKSSRDLRPCDRQENARIAAAECFLAAQKARSRGDTTRAASLETQGRTIARWGGGKQRN